MTQMFSNLEYHIVFSTQIPSPLVRGWMTWADRDFQGYRPSLLTNRPSGAFFWLRVSQF